MVRIQRPPKKKKQESLARRLFAAGAAGVTVLTGGVLGLRSAGAVKPPVAQLRLRTDLAAGAGRTPGASGPGGMTVAEEVRIKAETERFLSELRHIDDESKQQRSFLAQLLNISPVQAEVDESALNTEIQRLAASGGLQEAVRDAIVNGGFTADQAAAALQAAGISSSVISDIAVNLGATPGQAAAYAQPSYVPSSEADVYVPPPAAAVLPVSPVAPIIPSPVVEPGPPVLPPAAPVVPVAPSVPASNLSGAWAPRAPGDIPPPLPNPVVPEGESRFVITPGEESVIPERIVYVDNQPVFVTPEGAVLDVNRNQTPYTVDPNGQVFMQGSAAPIGTIQLQSPGIEEVPREVFVPVPPPAPAEPAPAPTPLPAPVTTIEYGGERFRVPLEGGAITTEADAPTPYRFEFEPGRAGDGRVVGPAGEEVGRIRDGAFVPTPPPQVSPPPAPAESQPAPPVVPPAPTPPAPVGPATPLGIPIPAPVAPVGTQVEVDGQVFTVPAGEGFASASGPNGQTTQYYVVAPRPGETDRVVRYGGMFGEEIGKVVGTTFVPRPEVASPAPTVATPPSPGPTPAPAPVTLSIGGNTYEINPQTLHVTKPA
ncbi:hypothetical protein HYW67_02255, partial [Candidatus Parcubacteria bacterium]|nr:hypothetical protein [Candidatus Parcubacteria bacterium]